MIEASIIIPSSLSAKNASSITLLAISSYASLTHSSISAKNGGSSVVFVELITYWPVVFSFTTETVLAPVIVTTALFTVATIFVLEENTPLIKFLILVAWVAAVPLTWKSASLYAALLLAFKRTSFTKDTNNT